MVDLCEQLHSKLFLTHVIIGFNDHAQQVPRSEMAKGRTFLDAYLLLL